jgi:hydroxymethylglutaryl-CoA lyase
VSQQVTVREVGPRDGFQNEPDAIPTADKIRLIEALAAANLKRIEVTSFVRADLLPQLADAGEVLERIEVPGDVALSVLVPNPRGLTAALRYRPHFHEVGVFVSASETHNRRNVNRSIAESMAGLHEMIPAIHAEGLHCQATIATAFGCPYEGRVPADRVLGLALELAEAGVDEIGLGDTTGMANPRQAAELFAALRERLGGMELTAHFHNTRGQGLANALAALDAGIDSFESSFGELGGCPVPPGSTGNIATEDLVSMFHEMEIDTGIDLEALLDASRAVQEVLGRPLGSHLLSAGPIVWQ